MSEFDQVPFGDFKALEKAIGPQTAGVLLEPMQGEGGLRAFTTQFMKDLRALCDKHDILLVMDEVQTGIGRTGKMFGFQHYGVTPDVMALAKGLGGGVPIGACVAKGKAASLFTPGTHGSTFGGTPLACSAALATLDVMVNEKVCENATEVGEHIRTTLRRQLAETPGVKEVRGQGMLNGIELDRPCGDLVGRARDDEKLIINVTADSVIRLVPPLIITTAEADEIVSILVPIIQQFLAAA